jgi:hypothetical protein
MPTYIDLINYFWAVRRARRDIIGEREIVLFFLLADAANRTNWQDSVDVSTESLCYELDCSKMGITRSRDKLVEAGLVTFEKGSRGKCPRYSLGSCYSKHPKPVTPSKDRQTDKTERDESSTDSLCFEEIVSEVEAAFPKRADVGIIAKKLQDHGGKFNATRLKHWVKIEKEPQFKQPPSVGIPQPTAGWEARVPGELGKRGWDYVWKHYPEEAKAAIQATKGEGVNAVT